jgi:NAD(P)H-dependent FMN reductase
MFTVIAGTNRPLSNTLKVSRLVENILLGSGESVSLLDLSRLPEELFAPTSYAAKPATFRPFQETVLEAEGVVTVVPEYNGSFPGVLKYFIDMLQFPESLLGKPAAFVGLSSGRWGGLRAVEQLQMVFQYRHAHLYGRRVFLPDVGSLVDDRGRLSDKATMDRLENAVLGFADFCNRLRED